MKRIWMTSLLFFFLCNHAAGAAAPTMPMLEDAFFSVLFPQVNAAVEKHYGQLKKYDCPQIMEMKKLYSGTYLFEAKVAIIKYEQSLGEKPKPPFERLIITFRNDEGEWTVKSTKAEKLPNNTKLSCRKPL